MLSLVICSVNPSYLEQVKTSIASTIGVNYELLVWDNRQKNIGLCEVYNKMAAQAQFPYICFLHEDIFFETNNWGSILVKVFEQDTAIGLVGVAGATYKSKAYSGWHTGQTVFDRYNITHRINGIDERMRMPEDDPQYVHQVVCTDGVFMICRKEVWSSVQFDDQLLKGFHLYDIDFSLRTAKKHKVAVVTNIDIVHITQGGDYGSRWVDETIRYHSKRSDLMPLSLIGLPSKKYDTRIAAVWIDFLKDKDISFGRRIKWIMNQQLYAKPSLWYGITKFILYKPLGLKSLHKIFKKG